MNAFYCSADQQIYLSNTLGEILAPFDESQRAGDLVMAHEFGHAIQGRTGDHRLVAGHQTEAHSETAPGSSSAGGRSSGGLLRRAVHAVGVGLARAPAGRRRADPADIFNSGDDMLSGEPNVDGDHGLGRSRQSWGSTGLGTDQVGQCNTFTAPAARSASGGSGSGVRAVSRAVAMAAMPSPRPVSPSPSVVVAGA